MGDPQQVATARTWMTAYADGDVDRFLSTMTPGWRVHDSDGSASTADDLAGSRGSIGTPSPRRR
jgi:hypothetical protein